MPIKFRSLTSRKFAAGSAFACIALASMAVTASEAKKEVRSAPDSRYISSKAIEQKRGKYKLSVPGKGAFKITRVQSRNGQKKRCLIDRASLTEIISTNNFAVPGRPARDLTVTMKATKVGKNTVCSGVGSGCIIIISTWDPDDALPPG